MFGCGLKAHASEYRNIGSGRKRYVHCVIFAWALVEIFQPPSQAVGLNARDGVLAGVEGRL